MNPQEKIPNFLKIGKHLTEDLPIYAGVTGLNFFKDSFKKQGFIDSYLKKWDLRKNDPEPMRSVLLKSAQLRDSLQILEQSKERVVFGTHSPYARIHNQGGVVHMPITPKMRKFFWFKFSKTKDERYKHMALTKKQSFTIQMPKRQFIGHSQSLMHEIEDWLLDEIVKRFKQK